MVIVPVRLAKTAPTPFLFEKKMTKYSSCIFELGFQIPRTLNSELFQVLLRIIQRQPISSNSIHFYRAMLAQSAVIRTFIRHKDRQYKIETETDGIIRKLKKRTIPHKKIKTY